MATDRRLQPLTNFSEKKKTYLYFILQNKIRVSGTRHSFNTLDLRSSPFFVIGIKSVALSLRDDLRIIK